MATVVIYAALTKICEFTSPLPEITTCEPPCIGLYVIVGISGAIVSNVTEYSPVPEMFPVLSLESIMNVFTPSISEVPLVHPVEELLFTIDELL